MKTLGPAALLLLLLTGAGLTGRAQPQKIFMEHVDSLMAREPKPLLLLLTAPWCRYCRMQQSQLRRNEAFTRAKGSFYYVAFDVENSRLPIVFNGRTYTYRTYGAATGVHTLAEALMGSPQLSYPAWIVMDSRYRILARYNGLLTKQQVSRLLQVLDDVYGNETEAPAPGSEFYETNGHSG